MISLPLCFSFLVHFPHNLCVLDHRALLRLLNGQTRQDLDLLWLWLKVWRQVLEKRKSGACFHTTCHCVTIMSHFDPFPFLSCHNHGHWSAHRKCLWIGKVLWEYRKSFKRCHSNRPACLTSSTNIANSFTLEGQWLITGTLSWGTISNHVIGPKGPSFGYHLPKCSNVALIVTAPLAKKRMLHCSSRVIQSCWLTNMWREVPFLWTNWPGPSQMMRGAAIGDRWLRSAFVERTRFFPRPR